MSQDVPDKGFITSRQLPAKEARIVEAARKRQFKAKLPDHDRVTGRFGLHYEVPGQPVKTAEFVVSSPSEVLDGEPYERRMKASKEGQLLDTGWIDSPRTIVIENTVGKGLPANPSSEELERISQSYLYLTWQLGDAPCLRISAGRGAWLELADPQVVPFISAAFDKTPYILWVFPG